MKKATIEPFKDSFALFIGINSKRIDWFNNSYVEVNVYQIDNNWNPVLSPDVQMKPCSNIELREYMD